MRAYRLPAGITAEYSVYIRGQSQVWLVQARNQTEAKRKVVAMPDTPCFTVAELDAQRVVQGVGQTV